MTRKARVDKAPSNLPDDDELDLTEELIHDLRVAFNLFDQDGSGEITKEELKVCIESLGKSPSDTDLEATFKELDKDGSGSIDFREFAHFMRKQMSNDEDEELVKEAFKIFDADGSGAVTKDELVATLEDVMKGTGETLPDEDIDEMIREADADGDGQINYVEFQTLMKQES